MVAPVLEKIASGLNNYNDYLKLTDKKIEFKDNEREGTFETQELQSITILKDERNIFHKIQLLSKNNDQIIIDLDKMELEAFYESINKFIETHYKNLLR
jgi:cytidylate kinase